MSRRSNRNARSARVCGGSVVTVNSAVVGDGRRICRRAAVVSMAVVGIIDNCYEHTGMLMFKRSITLFGNYGRQLTSSGGVWRAIVFKAPVVVRMWSGAISGTVGI